MAFLRSLIKTWFWQFLPVKFRRNLLSRYTSRIAPTINTKAKPKFPVIIAGTFRSATGLGQSARLSYLALKNEGIPVKGIDLTEDLSQPVDLDFPLDDARADVGTGTLVLHVNSPLVPLAMMKLGKQLIQEKYIVGYWAWELPHTPPDWKYGIPFVREIWTPSKFTKDAILPICENRPVQVVHHPVAYGFTASEQAKNSSGNRFEVLMAFNFASGYARKNPGAAIAAFRLAFGHDENVKFTIKTINADHYPDGMKLLKDAISNARNIEVISKFLTDAELHELYQKTDVVISLHRSEGFGLTIAEGMLHGKAVIATDWSGNSDFMDDKTTMPIPFDLIEARDDQHTYDYPEMHWANANIDEAARALLKLRSNVKFRHSLGAAATKQAHKLLGTSLYAKNVIQYLRLEP